MNFGLFFTVWDRALGTFKPGSDRAPRVADIGIQECPHFPQSYARQLRIPFERGSPCEPRETPVAAREASTAKG